MAVVRVFNPSNPRPRKLSYDQVRLKQDRAVDFLDNTDQPDLADEIESLSVAEYAARKGYRLTDDSNPNRKEVNSMAKREDLTTALQKLNDAAGQLTNAAKRMNRANPNSNAGDGGNGQSGDLDRVLNRIDTAASLLADGDPDAALDALNDTLDDFDYYDDDDDD